jgi:hypothetical protein
MQFVLLIYQGEGLQQRGKPEEWAKIYAEYGALTQDLKAKGQLAAGYAMRPVAESRTVRSRDGKIAVSTGPAYATEDQLSAVNLIEAASLEDAVEIAGRFPSARWGSIEVRALMEYKQTPSETYKK